MLNDFKLKDKEAIIILYFCPNKHYFQKLVFIVISTIYKGPFNTPIIAKFYLLLPHLTPHPHPMGEDGGNQADAVSNSIPNFRAHQLKNNTPWGHTIPVIVYYRGETPNPSSQPWPHYLTTIMLFILVHLPLPSSNFLSAPPPPPLPPSPPPLPFPSTSHSELRI